jgi:hypothetical protein
VSAATMADPQSSPEFLSIRQERESAQQADDVSHRKRRTLNADEKSGASALAPNSAENCEQCSTNTKDNTMNGMAPR